MCELKTRLDLRVARVYIIDCMEKELAEYTFRAIQLTEGYNLIDDLDALERAALDKYKKENIV